MKVAVDVGTAFLSNDEGWWNSFCRTIDDCKRFFIFKSL